MRILIIEDDADLCALMAANLREQGDTVDVCHEGDDGLRWMRERAHDLVLLDRMLPRLDGTTLLKTARREGIVTPVLMVTALGAVGDRVEGLDSGADDYIVKPFAVDELLARVRALKRRPREFQLADSVTLDSLRLEPSEKTLYSGERKCSLSSRETALLELLMRNLGKSIPRATIFSYVWGPDAQVEDGNLDNYIHFVRDRLKEVGCGYGLATILGGGNRFERLSGDA